MAAHTDAPCFKIKPSPEMIVDRTYLKLNTEVYGGPMIKVSANQNFSTNGDSAAVYETLCREAGIPVQKFVSRSDLRGGSSLGPISASQLDIRALDVGHPALAMHSIRELAGILDHEYIKRSFERFFSA